MLGAASCSPAETATPSEQTPADTYVVHPRLADCTWGHDPQTTTFALNTIEPTDRYIIDFPPDELGPEDGRELGDDFHRLQSAYRGFVDRARVFEATVIGRARPHVVESRFHAVFESFLQLRSAADLVRRQGNDAALRAIIEGKHVHRAKNNMLVYALWAAEAVGRAGPVLKVDRELLPRDALAIVLTDISPTAAIGIDLRPVELPAPPSRARDRYDYEARIYDAHEFLVFRFYVEAATKKRPLELERIFGALHLQTAENVGETLFGPDNVPRLSDEYVARLRRAVRSCDWAVYAAENYTSFLGELAIADPAPGRVQLALQAARELTRATSDAGSMRAIGATGAYWEARLEPAEGKQDDRQAFHDLKTLIDSNPGKFSPLAWYRMCHLRGLTC